MHDLVFTVIMAAGNGSGKVTVGRKQVGFVILCVFSIVVIRNMMDRTTRLSSTMNVAIKELVTAGSTSKDQ